MQSGPDNQQVNLTTPVPVLMIYVTAVVEPDNSVHFFNDIYGHETSECSPGQGAAVSINWLATSSAIERGALAGPFRRRHRKDLGNC